LVNLSLSLYNLLQAWRRSWRSNCSIHNNFKAFSIRTTGLLLLLLLLLLLCQRVRVIMNPKLLLLLDRTDHGPSLFLFLSSLMQITATLTKGNLHCRQEHTTVLLSLTFLLSSCAARQTLHANPKWLTCP
jgi:hypothetical protein